MPMNAGQKTPKSPEYFTKRRLGWAALAGLFGCAACCLPIAGALGLGSGASAALAALSTPSHQFLVGGPGSGGAAERTGGARARLLPFPEPGGEACGRSADLGGPRRRQRHRAAG